MFNLTEEGISELEDYSPSQRDKMVNELTLVKKDNRSMESCLFK